MPEHERIMGLASGKALAGIGRFTSMDAMIWNMRGRASSERRSPGQGNAAAEIHQPLSGK